MFRATDYWISIVELKGYQRDAERIFSLEEREELTEFLATTPHVGDIIPQTGGVRKLRWAAKGSGKRGGARVIYYFRDLNMPVFLLAVFGKGERADLTMSDRHALAGLVDELVGEYGKRTIARAMQGDQR